jgi:Ribbon-helix-helix protein, copG family
MASQSTQISASVSKETKKLLDAYTRKRGIKKSFVIEQALRHHLLAAEEIPEEFIVPPVVRVRIEGLKAIVAQLESIEPPTAAMLELMRPR